MPQARLIQHCDELLGTGDLLAAAWAKVDWHREVEHPDWFRRYVEMEAEATVVREYQSSWVSGLLQTPAYARAILSQGDAAGDEALIAERVAARLSRQNRFLAPDGPLLVVVLDESAIERRVGGRQVMYEQLQHLLRVGARPNVVLQVAPYELGERTPAGVSFTLIDLPEGAQWLYTEGLAKGHFISEPHQLLRRSKAYERLRADALSASDSARLIRSVMEELLNVSPKADLSAAHWFKSAHSDQEGGNCIEVAYNLDAVVPVRDSKSPDAPGLVFPRDAWAAFVRAAAAGAFGEV